MASCNGKYITTILKGAVKKGRFRVKVHTGMGSSKNPLPTTGMEEFIPNRPIKKNKQANPKLLDQEVGRKCRKR